MEDRLRWWSGKTNITALKPQSSYPLLLQNQRPLVIRIQLFPCQIRGPQNSLLLVFYRLPDLIHPNLNSSIQIADFDIGAQFAKLVGNSTLLFSDFAPYYPMSCPAIVGHSFSNW